ncbi:MAG: sulfite exporter TauE/SafE family protein [Bacteriovoracaceae bacterium]
MIDLFCGVLIGIVMGLTGAGGALIAIPLFMQFMGQSLKEASLYSLVAVVVASLLNFFAQKSFTQYRIGAAIVVSSAIASYLTVPFKENLSSFWIAILLSAISLYALYTVWFPLRIKNDSVKSHQSLWVSLVIGLILGTLTTFTGLGGGVLMLPVLLGIYRFSQPQAVATSLFAVGLSSLSSLIIQIYKGAEFEFGKGFLFLLLGILSAVVILKKYTHHLKADFVVKLRQIVFSVVVIIALSKIFQQA